MHFRGHVAVHWFDLPKSRAHRCIMMHITSYIPYTTQYNMATNRDKDTCQRRWCITALRETETDCIQIRKYKLMQGKSYGTQIQYFAAFLALFNGTLFESKSKGLQNAKTSVWENRWHVSIHTTSRWGSLRPWHCSTLINKVDKLPTPHLLLWSPCQSHPPSSTHFLQTISMYRSLSQLFLPGMWRVSMVIFPPSKPGRNWPLLVEQNLMGALRWAHQLQNFSAISWMGIDSGM